MLSIIFCLFTSCKHKYGYYISKSIKKNYLVLKITYTDTHINFLFLIISLYLFVFDLYV